MVESANTATEDLESLLRLTWSATLLFFGCCAPPRFFVVVVVVVVLCALVVVLRVRDLSQSVGLPVEAKQLGSEQPRNSRLGPRMSCYK